MADQTDSDFLKEVKEGFRANAEEHRKIMEAIAQNETRSQLLESAVMELQRSNRELRESNNLMRTAMLGDIKTGRAGLMQTVQSLRDFQAGMKKALWTAVGSLIVASVGGLIAALRMSAL